MRLTVATNFDDALLEGLRRWPVVEVYGKKTADAAGGGRASYQVPGIGWPRVRRHAALARRLGIRFNYLLNAACLDNAESTRRGQRRLRRLLDRVVEAGIEDVTVASPYLLRLVKTLHPDVRVRISVFAGIDHVRKARQWEEWGADTLVLDSLLVNREFRLLQAIRRAVRCELQLLVNNHCLQSCAMAPHHMNALAHASQSGHRDRGFLVDWCWLRCTAARLRDPVHYVRADWIRPEDLHHYERIGYDAFKITERAAPTPALLARVQAYATRRWEGNLLDLVQPYAYPRALAGAGGRRRLWWRLRYLMRPGMASPAGLWRLKRLADRRAMLDPVEGSPPVWMDNRALDGFLDRFVNEGGCKDRDCAPCGHCHRFAARAVRVEPGYRREALGAYEEIFDDLEAGGMWGLEGRHRNTRDGAPRRIPTRAPLAS